MTNTTFHTIAHVETETKGDYGYLKLTEGLTGDPAAVLMLSESDAQEVGLMLLGLHFKLQSERVARGDRKIYSDAEIDDAVTIATRAGYKLIR